jgi:hypothetical protein
MTNITLIENAIKVEYDVATEYVLTMSSKYYVLSQILSRNSFISMFINK